MGDTYLLDGATEEEISLGQALHKSEAREIDVHALFSVETPTVDEYVSLGDHDGAMHLTDMLAT